jgi:rod shape-determining protein MreC
MLKKGILFIPVILGIGILLMGTSFNLFNIDTVLSSSHMVAKQATSYCAYPFLAMQHRLINPIKVWWQHKHAVHELHDTITHLQNQCDTLNAEIIALHASRAYADDIHELQTFKKRYEQHAHITQIIAKSFSNQSHYFLVDAGAQDNIYQDMVAVYKNCLVGRVVEVYPWYSKVQLITDTMCKVSASCASSRALGIHRGQNVENETIMQYVSHLDKVAVGDAVLSSGEGLVFPQGFSLGTIATCKQDGLYHTITVKPSLDLRSLQYCALLDKADI